MANYSNNEYTDMIKIYGETRSNGRAAQRLYSQRFPNRQVPSHKIFAKIEARLRATASFKPNKTNCGRPRHRRVPRFEEEVLHCVEENPRASTRGIARAMNTSHSNVWRVLNEQLLHPFHLQKVQPLLPDDYAPRIEYCRWVLNKHQENDQFPRSILFTDEACFTRDGCYNCHNNHLWDEENPHGTFSVGHQHKFSVNVWAGIIGEKLIGPYVLPQRLNGPIYLNFLEEVLPELLEDVPLRVRQEMWFQHDGAPPHFSIPVREHLNRTFRRRWIGRGGPVNWPARSPDLTPLDYFLWGHIKSIVYETPVNSVEELRARIEAASLPIRNTPGIFNNVHRNMIRRCNACIQVNGRNFEQFL